MAIFHCSPLDNTFQYALPFFAFYNRLILFEFCERRLESPAHDEHYCLQRSGSYRRSHELCEQLG